MVKVPKAQMMKWINALRSGKYKQGKGQLQSIDGSYCCLGVACDVLIPADLQSHYITDLGLIRLIGGRPISQPAAPLWLTEVNGHIATLLDGTELYSWDASLISLNDRHEFSFDEIADILQAIYIEEVLK